MVIISGDFFLRALKFSYANVIFLKKSPFLFYQNLVQCWWHYYHKKCEFLRKQFPNSVVTTKKSNQHMAFVTLSYVESASHIHHNGLYRNGRSRICRSRSLALGMLLVVLTLFLILNAFGNKVYKISFPFLSVLCLS